MLTSLLPQGSLWLPCAASDQPICHPKPPTALLYKALFIFPFSCFCLQSLSTGPRTFCRVPDSSSTVGSHCWGISFKSFMNVQGLGSWVSQGLHMKGAAHTEQFIFMEKICVCVCVHECRCILNNFFNGRIWKHQLIFLILSSTSLT